MAGMMSETYVLQVLSNGIQQIQQDTSLLDDILDALNTQELTSAKSYFGNPKTKIIVAPGFPNEQTPMPFVGVTVAEEHQDDANTPIGYAFDRIDNGDGTWTDVRGIAVDGTIKATIYTPNADVIIWLSAICQWALISQYDFFMSESGAAMYEVSSGLGDYEPQPQWLPTFVFSRGAYLRGKWMKTIKSSPNVVTSTSTTATFIDITTLNG